MNMIKQYRLAGSLSVAILAMAGGMPTTVVAAPAADAQMCLPKTLNAEQASAIQASLIAALQNASGFKQAAPLQSSSAPQHAGGPAVDVVIAQAVMNGIAQYGSDLAGSVSSVVMDTAEQQGVPPCAIGKGNARAAATEEGTNSKAASAIASAVGKEGKAAEVTCFQTAAKEFGHPNLAAIAGSPVTLGEQVACAPVAPPAVVVKEEGLVKHNNHGLPWFPGGGGAGGTIAGCLNPSCTKM